VAEALADVRKAEANVAKTIIRAPFSGVITNKNVSVGQIVAANSPVLSIISLGNFEIEANIPEVEIAKLTVGNTATVTLDAYGNDVPFLATVTVIDPAERVIDGVSTYEVTLNFKEEDARIRSGMTANLEIKTAEKDDVVIIPERAVVIEGNKKIVEVLDGTGNSIKREVQTGLRGQGGVVEITQGLKEGETIIVSRTK
jgi:HlyD family secretion protein